LNSGLNLDLKTLDEFDDFLAGLFGDTLLDKNIHLYCAMGGGFDILEVQTLGRHFKPSALTDEHLGNCFNLPIISSNNVNRLSFSVESDLGIHVFEIESRGDFTLHVVDCIVQCLQVYLAHHIY